MKPSITTTITLAFILAGLFSGTSIGLAQAVRESQTGASRPATIATSGNLGDDEINKELSALLEKAAAHRNEEESEPSDAPDRAPSQTPPEGESSANADELPVWLL